MGMDWSLREGYAWAEDKEHCEEYGRMLTADPSKVSKRAKKRGLPQLGTLGAGNHYAEIQVVDHIYDKHAADRMGISMGQVNCCCCCFCWSCCCFCCDDCCYVAADTAVPFCGC